MSPLAGDHLNVMRGTLLLFAKTTVNQNLLWWRMVAFILVQMNSGNQIKCTESKPLTWRNYPTETMAWWRSATLGGFNNSIPINKMNVKRTMQGNTRVRVQYAVAADRYIFTLINGQHWTHLRSVILLLGNRFTDHPELHVELGPRHAG